MKKERTMSTSSRQTRTRCSSFGAVVYTMGLLSVSAVCFVHGGTALAQEPTRESKSSAEHQEHVYSEKDFSTQLKGTQEDYPLIARAFSFLQRVPRFCTVNETCFRRTQASCLRQGLPATFCVDEAEQVCCEPLALAPPEEQPGIVFKGSWCCKSCTGGPPLACTGCSSAPNVGFCGGALNPGTTIFQDCPGNTTETVDGTVTCY